MCKRQLVPHPLPRDLKSIHRCGQTYGVSQWAVDIPTSAFSPGPKRGSVALPSESLYVAGSGPVGTLQTW